MFSMKPNTSLGLDGIPPSLIQHKWEIVGDDFCQATLNFTEGGIHAQGNELNFHSINSKDGKT